MIHDSIKKLNQGKSVIIFDDGAPIPCGYFFAAADNLQEEEVLKIVNLGKGILLVPLCEKLAQAKGLYPIANDTTHPFPITIGVEARSGVGSGISISDRTKTIKAILDSNSSQKNIAAPGHIYPMPAKNGGLLLKTGIAEACIDLLKIAGLSEVGVTSHILNDKGQFMNEVDLIKLSEKEDIPIVKLSSIIQYRLVNEEIVKLSSTANLPTKQFGNFKVHCFISTHDSAEHLVLSKGDISLTNPILARMHSEKKLGDIFSLSPNQDRDKINISLAKISKEERGVLVYIRKAKKNLISASLKMENEKKSKDSLVELRELGVGAQILKSLGISQIRLLTSEKKVLNNLGAYGISVVEQIAISEVEGTI